MSLRTSFLLAILLVGTLAITYSSLPGVSASVSPMNDRKVAPDFVAKDTRGADLKLSDYRGKVVLVNFWATWCGPCRIEIPWFVEFEKSYSDRGFTVIGVSMDEEGWEAVKPFIAQQRVNYPVVIGTDALTQAYGDISSLPTTFLIDREGEIAARHVGLVSKSAYESEIASLLRR